MNGPHRLLDNELCIDCQHRTWRRTTTVIKQRRVVALIDVNSFSTQVELLDYPQLRHHPCATVVLNPGGRDLVLSLNYQAKDSGVKRLMTRKEAEKQCPGIKIFTIPMKWKKPDQMKYTKAGDEVLDVIMEFARERKIKVERNSDDEAYLDLTRCVRNIVWSRRRMNIPYPSLAQIKSVIEGHRRISVEEGRYLNRRSRRRFDNTHLVIGAHLVRHIREEILKRTGLRTSAGISYNKLLAKLACNLNKPDMQTVLFKTGIKRVLAGIDIKELEGLGGVLGDKVKEYLEERLDVKPTIGKLSQICWDCLKDALKLDTRKANELYYKAHGVDERPVVKKLFTMTMSTGRTFSGSERPRNYDQIVEWIWNLCGDLNDKLEYRLTRDPSRQPKDVKAMFYFDNSETNSKTVKFVPWEQMAQDIVDKAFPDQEFDGVVRMIKLILYFQQPTQPVSAVFFNRRPTRSRRRSDEMSSSEELQRMRGVVENCCLMVASVDEERFEQQSALFEFYAESHFLYQKRFKIF